MDKDALLSHLVGEDERLLGAKLLDRVARTTRDGSPEVTTFLDPHQQDVAKSIFGSIDVVRYRLYGGYRDAERQRIVVYPEYYLPELLEIPVRAIEIQGKFETKPSHRNVLGSLMALGITRDQIGDILLIENGCQVIVSTEMTDFFLANVSRIGRTLVTTEEIDLERLAITPQRVKEIRTTVASLRLDALAAAGFGTSRTKMAREIKMERVKVNWKTVTNPAAEMKEGDIVSIRGRGRVHIDSIEGKTRKGRTNALLMRYQ